MRNDIRSSYVVKALFCYRLLRSDETHPPTSNRDSVTSPGDSSVDQSFQSADMTQDEIRDYVQ